MTHFTKEQDIDSPGKSERLACSVPECHVYYIPIPQGVLTNETFILSDISRMSAERQAFLNGSDMPSANLVKTQQYVLPRWALQQASVHCSANRANT